MKFQPAILLLFLTTTLVSACSMRQIVSPLPTQSVPVADTTTPTSSTSVTNSITPTQAPSPDIISSTNEPVTVTFGAYEAKRQFYEPLMAAFTANNPNIHVQFVALDTFGNEGHSTRGIVRLADTAEAYVRPEDRDQGYLRDLAPFIDADPTFNRSDYYPGAFGAFDHHGSITVLPRLIHVPLLAYNKSLWLTNGIPEPAPDWTWTDVIEVAETITQHHGDTTEIYGLLDRQTGFPLLFAAELHSHGVDIFSTPLPNVQLDHPDVITAMQQLVDRIQTGVILIPETQMVHLGVMGDDELTTDDLQQMVRDQQLGIWPVNAIDLDLDNAALPFELGIVPAPTLPRFADGSLGYIMSSGTQHPEAAWRWLSFLSHQLNYETGSDISLVPARRSLAELSDYWSGLNTEISSAMRTAIEQPASEVFILDPQLRVALSTPWFPMISGNQSIEMGLQDAQASLEQLLAEMPQTTSETNQNSIIVDPPLSAQANTNAVIFDATSLDVAAVEQIAQAFTLEHPEITLGIRQVTDPERDPNDIKPITRADCFAWSAPAIPSEITTTLDLRPLVDADVLFDLNDYPQTVLTLFEQGTTLYGLPHTINFRVLNYNQALFSAHGLQPPDPDWSLADLKYTAQQLTSISRRSEQYGYAQLINHPDDVFFFLQQFNASIVQGSSESLQLDFTNDRVLAALQYYIELLRSYSPEAQLSGYKAVSMPDHISERIRRGEIGMWLDFGMQPRFFDPRYQKQPAPNFMPAIVPPPLQNRVVTLHDMRIQGLYISAHTQHREACWEWIKYLTTEVSSMRGHFPARTSVARSEAFTSQAPTGSIEVYEFYQEALQNAPHSNETTLPLDFNYYWFYQAVDKALQGADIEEELSNAQLITEKYMLCVHSEKGHNECVRQVDPEYQGFLDPE